FTAKTGETVAFIGSTGSGKSTLINLIPRFYDVTEGSIKINGVGAYIQLNSLFNPKSIKFMLYSLSYLSKSFNSDRLSGVTTKTFG
ncbi:ATP-binding cassette domain-containing protein, partial [Clostridioides difficile]|uniref:ATP-binding cassette domain-containing protein n=1 Tax=Clostridioides difficile TaxID=1496 RepID=UPI003F8D5FAC